METKCRLFGICGTSGSGKSFIAKYILENLGPENISILYQDNYYKKREDQQKDNNGHYNFDLPSSFHQDEFFEASRSFQPQIILSASKDSSFDSLETLMPC